MVIRIKYRIRSCGQCGSCDNFEPNRNGVCLNDDVVERVILKECTSVEIDKRGIGVLEIDEDWRLLLDDVASVQVDCGQGFVTEWESDVVKSDWVDPLEPPAR